MKYLGLLAVLRLLPLLGSAYAQVTDDLAGQAPPPAILPEDDTVGPVGLVDELMLAHSDLTDIMLRQSIGDFDTPDLPFLLTYVDEDNWELIVVMDAFAALLGFEYEEDAVRVAIGRDVQVNVLYGEIYLEAAPSRTQQWIQLYKEKCINVRPGHVAICNYATNLLRQAGVNLSTLGSTTSSRTLSSQNPCNAGSSSLACYYYRLYQDNCIPRHSISRCTTYAAQIESAGYALPTTAPNRDTTPPVITVPRTIIKTTSDPDGARVYYSVSARDGVDGRVSVSCSPRSGSTFDTGYTRVSCTARDSAGNPASRSFYVNVRYNPADTTPPVITVPGTITRTTSDPDGARVYYSVSARDGVDGRVSVSCSPSSDSVFAVGSTTVSCTASDSAGNVRRASFVVNVKLNHMITVPDTITKSTTNPNGLVVEYQVTARDESNIMLSPVCSPASGSLFPARPTTVNCTVEDSSGNVGRASFLVNVLFHVPDDVEFYGGETYIMIFRNSTGAYWSTGTITLGASDTNGAVGMVVSGHTAEIDDPNIYNHRFVSNDASSSPPDTTVVSYNVPVAHVGGSVDAAFILITEPNIIVHDQIRAHDGTIIDVTQGRLADVDRIEPIHIYGINNNGMGTLLFKNATSGSGLANVGISNYASSGGDSGAPIIHYEDDTAHIIGSHVGVLCVFESPSEGQQRINVNGYYYLCDGDTDVFYYTLFSAWENIVDTLDLR
ncbi:MAG: HYR domain-containing protein [Nitrosopumilus sp.]|nr:HYR domain-containing protein [Nitrosopumilus sp.]